MRVEFHSSFISATADGSCLAMPPVTATPVTSGSLWIKNHFTKLYSATVQIKLSRDVAVIQPILYSVVVLGALASLQADSAMHASTMRSHNSELRHSLDV